MTLYVIAGPTASGKTAVAIELAKQLDGEVVSADSMQVYKHMNIGTAKPTTEEMGGIPHHLIDIITPDTQFSVAEYQKLASHAINDIISRNKTPILAGGTGFYINAVVHGTEFNQISEEENQKEERLRNHYTSLAKEKGANFLHKKLHEKDPDAANAVHPNNIKRVARALSYIKTTGALFSLHNKAQKNRALLYNMYNSKFFTLSFPRETLYSRINTRTLAMWDNGLPQEVQNLLRHYDLGLAAMQGIGYKETVMFLNNQYTKEEAIDAISQSTRHYAKRQETWFRHQAPTATPILAMGKTAKDVAVEIMKGV